jgi:hypothetical protein
LIEKIEELETEKNKLKTLQIDTSMKDFENYLLITSPFGEKNIESIPTVRKAKAIEVFSYSC